MRSCNEPNHSQQHWPGNDLKGSDSAAKEQGRLVELPGQRNVFLRSTPGVQGAGAGAAFLAPAGLNDEPSARARRELWTLGAATTGAAIGRYRASKPPLT